MKIPETKKNRAASVSGRLRLRRRTAKCQKDAGWRGRCAASQPGPCWVFPGWIRLLSTKQSEQKEIIRLDNSNSRVTGSLQERQKGMRAKKKKQFRNLATCLTGERVADTFQGPGEAIAQETEGASGLEISFLWRQQINKRRLRNSGAW